MLKTENDTDVKLVRVSVILLVVFLLPITSWFWNWAFKLNLLDFITKSSKYLISNTLIANLLNICFYGVLIFHIGKASIASVGINRTKTINALLVSILSWVVTLLIFIVFSFINEIAIEINPSVRQEVKLAIGQLFGNALFEEIIFRGFLFSQILIRLKNKYNRINSFIFASVISSFVFSVIHIPNRMFIHEVTNLLADCVMTFLFGIIFCAIFYWRKNLLYVVVIHSFLNYALFVINTNDIPINLLFVLLYIGFILIESIFDLKYERKRFN